MLDYIKCLFLFIFSTFIYYSIGNIFSKENNKDFSYNYILGYILFTFIVAVPGIFVQIIKLPWIIYCAYYVIVCILLLVFCIFKCKKDKLITKNNIISFLKQNYFIFVISFIVLGISFLYVWLFWANNHSDDGYYLGKIAEFPYMEQPFLTNPANGFYQSSILSYTVNTWELQASVSAYILKINPVVYARVYLSLITIFLLVNAVKGFSYKFIQMCDFQWMQKHWKNTIQYVTIIVLLFSCNSYILENFHLINSNDLWQFNGALYLASSIIRTSGFLILFMFYIDRNRIEAKDIILAIIISISFISKSSIALPLLVLFSMLHLFKIIIMMKKNRMLSISLYLVIVVLISFMITDDYNIQSLLIQYFSLNVKSILFWILIGVFVISLFFRNKNVNMLTLGCILIIVFMIVHPINNIFESVSMLPFVAGRIHLNYLYTLFVIATLYVYIMINFLFKKQILIVCFSIVSLLIFTMGSVKTFTMATGTVKDSYGVIYRNKEFIPKTTMRLSKKLNDLSKEKELYVQAPFISIVNGKSHTLSVSLRFWAPDIKVISSLHRYPTSSDSRFREFNEELQNYYDVFSSTPNDENYSFVNKLVNQYNVNCCIVENYESVLYLERSGFEFNDSVKDEINQKNYYICIR